MCMCIGLGGACGDGERAVGAAFCLYVCVFAHIDEYEYDMHICV